MLKEKMQAKWNMDDKEYWECIDEYCSINVSPHELINSIKMYSVLKNEDYLSKDAKAFIERSDRVFYYYKAHNSDGSNSYKNYIKEV